METVKIHTDFITLGQLLKFVNIASSGGDIKAILATKKITVDQEVDNRRGRKLYKGMVIDIQDYGVFKIV
ncbi:RNA-binding S4 domain-containing protein [Liberiplasma polymorphum]|jgi:ribosome-associated protein|uniref:RNA-binding S4 domain-containing protein n=1 Tax=Liberiplasma polymorphum TaxID=3374570 RepID=UPI003770D4F7